MIDGVGLGFANVVQRGTVGIVAAGGTGAQEAACLIDAAGGGVSEIVGVGGRDLSPQVGGAMFRAGMRRLAEDDETETLLLVSKAPAPEIAPVLAAEAPAGKRVVAAFVGAQQDVPELELYPTLEGGALAAVGAAPDDCADLERAVDARRDATAGRHVLGLFSGGSLAHEAVTILEPVLGPVAGTARGHAVIDLGTEEHTRGRPHPMVDLDLRTGMLRTAAGDDELGCVLLDVVLGHGAHPDPAGELAPVIATLAERATVIVRVCGTDGDPQDAARQARILRDAGALVAPSNAAAARLAARAVAGSPS
jgi:FdrA protein